MKPLRVIIGCEFSGIVRDSFRALGHDAWSCDLLPCEGDTAFHIQGDLLKVLGQGWDLGIFHPTCTYLCNSGVRWLAPGGKLNPPRHKLMQQACDFFAQLYWADIPAIGLENPVMHHYAKDYLLSARKVPSHTFTLQPWQHGEPEVKRSCFWLRNLPPLKPSRIVSGRTPRVHHASPGPNRWKERSRTLKGVANAMALQWSDFLSKPQS